MLLTEAVAKRVLRSSLIKTAEGVLIDDYAELAARKNWTFPLAAKAEVSAGGRGKSGGIIRCTNHTELKSAFEQIMGMTFSGEVPRGVLVEPWLEIEREIYLSVVVDPSAEGFAILYSPTGGVDVEDSENIVRYEFGCLENFRRYHLRKILSGVEDDEDLIQHLLSISNRLLQVALRFEATMVEINPLAVTAGSLTAVDAKIVLDETASFRNELTTQQIDVARAHEDETTAACRRARLVFIPMGGSVGLISGGAGMTMRAMDAVDEAGAEPAGFLDISNNPTPAGVRAAFEALQSLENVDRILVSIFGGGLDVGRLAKTIMDLWESKLIRLPVAFRLAGSGGDMATQLLGKYGFVNHQTLEVAVADVLGSEVAR